VKSAVEPVTPTRVRLIVEVPFEDLRPDLDHAYREVGKQVRVRGFRPGKVPPRLIDQQVGRGPVLEHAINDAIPRLYGEAIRSNDVQVLGQPDVEVTKFEDGQELVFTAEVDVRPDVELPEYAGIRVTVDDAEVTDEEVDEQLASLRERFTVLRAAGRAVEQGDYVLLDLAASVDGEEVVGGSATGMSYEVGSGQLMPGLDEALLGAAEGDTRTFETELQQGALAGRTAEVTATVRSVKVKELPALDDEFAQTASEFDTIEELRADTRARLERVRRLEQAVQARDRVLEALLSQVDVPLPEGVVKEEAQWRLRNMDEQLRQAGISKEDYLAAEGRDPADLEQELEDTSRRAVKTQLVLEAVASKEQLEVSEPELIDHIVRRAREADVSADVYARSVGESGQLGALAGEIARGKALAVVLERASVTDASGRPVDLDTIGKEFEEQERAAPPAPSAAQ
jgi:trigger factor